MKIAKIRVPLELTKQVNLKEINLTKKTLGSTVALVGRNGAGKSRVLRFVENYITTILLDDYLDDHFQDIPITITNQFSQLIINLKDYASQRKNSIHSQQIAAIDAQMYQSSRPLVQRFQQLGQAYIKNIDNDDLQNIKANIINNNAISFEQILTNSHFEFAVNNPSPPPQRNTLKLNNTSLNEFKVFNNQTTIDYFTKLSGAIVLEKLNLLLKHPENLELIEPKIRETESFILFDKFQSYVKAFLGKEFSYEAITQSNTLYSTLYFNNQPFNLTLLSPGQKTLFAYAILFFYLDVNSKTNIRESIIIIDEPEKHLHPEAQIALIDALKNIIGTTGQLWVATHSIHILSHLECDEIMMMKDDEIIQPSRTTPSNSLSDLMGTENHIDKLATFINSISEWAYSNFMLQCFKEPDVVFGKSINDPQFKLFKEFLENNSEIKLLDYGAGKGRIGYTIQEDEVMSKKIAYNAYAYEPDKNINDYELLNNVPDKREIYSKISEIPDNSFDCIVLCNVLHEIHPKEWINTLKAIKNALNHTGFLLIIEDRFLPKGENANEFGYLIFGDEETKILLDSVNSKNLKLAGTEFEKRIIFNAFQKSDINPTDASVLKAIKTLQNNTYNNIKKIRKEEKKDLSQGRRYANETQLYVNSTLAIEYLEK